MAMLGSMNVKETTGFEKKLGMVVTATASAHVT
jgi:hypothetical protein